MNPKTKSMTQRKATEAEIRERFECLHGTLIERSRRLFAGSEALAFGYGGIAAASRATGLSPQTVRHGLADNIATPDYDGILPFDRYINMFKHALHTIRGTGRKDCIAGNQRANVIKMETVHILFNGDSFQHLINVYMIG